jgi:hypothetical protein
MLTELIIFLAVLNATVGSQSLPLEITAVPGEPAATVSTPIPGLALDAATLTAVAGIAGGAYAAFRKSASRDNATADTTIRVADSLKETDYGVADTAAILSDALTQIPNFPNQELVKKAQDNARKWNKDNKEYYENLPTAPRPGELEGDKVKTKLAQVNKITEPTADP